jgi:hypothetical protein
MTYYLLCYTFDRSLRQLGEKLERDLKENGGSVGGYSFTPPGRNRGGSGLSNINGTVIARRLSGSGQ